MNSEAAQCSLVASVAWTSTSNLLELELLGELLIKLAELLHDLATSVDDSLLRTDLSVGLHTELEGSEKWMWDLVAGEEDVLRLGELCAEEVAESVVLLVEGEHGRIWDA